MDDEKDKVKDPEPENDEKELSPWQKKIEEQLNNLAEMFQNKQGQDESLKIPVPKPPEPEPEPEPEPMPDPEPMPAPKKKFLDWLL